MILNLSFGTEIIGCFLFQKLMFFSKFWGFSKNSEKNAIFIFNLPMQKWVQICDFISWIFSQCHKKHFETFFVFGHLLKKQECPKMKNPGLLFLEVFFRDFIITTIDCIVYYFFWNTFDCSINKCRNALENTYIL